MFLLATVFASMEGLPFTLFKFLFHGEAALRKLNDEKTVLKDRTIPQQPVDQWS